MVGELLLYWPCSMQGDNELMLHVPCWISQSGTTQGQVLDHYLYPHIGAARMTVVEEMAPIGRYLYNSKMIQFLQGNFKARRCEHSTLSVPTSVMLTKISKVFYGMLCLCLVLPALKRGPVKLLYRQRCFDVVLLV